MRWAYGVLIAAVAALSLAAPTQAAPRPERAPAGLPGAQVALERALGYFAPAQARPSFRRAAKNDPRGATIALRDLAAAFDRLSGADRRQAADILARPSDSGSQTQHYGVPRRYVRHRCPPGEDFCVHWTTRGFHAPSSSTWISKVVSVMKTVWDKEIDAAGYLKPMTDGNSGGHRGGNPNGRIDIFVADVGRQGIYGYCTTDDPRSSSQNNVSAYCVVDDDFSRNQFPFGAAGVSALKVTAAHEFHHAVQFRYDLREDRWLMEATATNMEAVVYPSIHDNYQYFKSSPLRSSNGTQNGPWWPIDLFNPSGSNQYGAWIFFRFACEWFTPGVHPLDSEPDCSIVKEFWESAKAQAGTRNGLKYSTRAISDVLVAKGTTFATVFREFGVANARPAAFYKDGDLYPTAGAVALGRSGPTSIAYGQPEFHMSNDYVSIRPAANASSLSMTFDFPGAPATPRATVLIFDTAGGVARTDVVLNGNGDSPFPPSTFSQATVSKVVVVITNAGTRFNCKKGTTFSCRGIPLDDSSTVDYKVNFNIS